MMPGDIQVAVLRKLPMLNRAKLLDDLRVPTGNRLEALRGDRDGQHSIRINDQWRICFRWTAGGPDDVEIVLGKRAVTADTDLRLARYFGLSEGFFLGLQADFDLMERRRAIMEELREIKPRAA